MIVVWLTMAFVAGFFLGAVLIYWLVVTDDPGRFRQEGEGHG